MFTARFHCPQGPKLGLSGLIIAQIFGHRMARSRKQSISDMALLVEILHLVSVLPVQNMRKVDHIMATHCGNFPVNSHHMDFQSTFSIQLTFWIHYMYEDFFKIITLNTKYSRWSSFKKQEPGMIYVALLLYWSSQTNRLTCMTANRADSLHHFHVTAFYWQDVSLQSLS